MKVKKILRASRGRIATTHTAFASGRTTQKMLPTGLQSKVFDLTSAPVLRSQMLSSLTCCWSQRKWPRNGPLTRSWLLWAGRT